MLQQLCLLLDMFLKAKIRVKTKIKLNKTLLLNISLFLINQKTFNN